MELSDELKLKIEVALTKAVCVILALDYDPVLDAIVVDARRAIKNVLESLNPGERGEDMLLKIYSDHIARTHVSLAGFEDRTPVDPDTGKPTDKPS